VDRRLVVGPVSREPLDLAAELTWQLPHNAGIIGSALGQAVRYDETAPIDSDVQFPPISRPLRPVLRRGPRAFANDLQAGTVDDQVDRSTMLSRFRGDVERLSSPRQGAVIRNGQVIETQHAEQ